MASITSATTGRRSSNPLGAGDRRRRALRPGADQRQLEPALDQLDENLEGIGAELPDGAVLTADGGYFSEENVETCEQHGVDPFIATGRFKHSEPPPPAPRGPIPKVRHPEAADGA